MAKLRLAVIGCGKAGRAQLHWFAAHPQCEIIAVHDPQTERAKACAQQYTAAISASWKEAAAHPDVELVSLCGPESVRARHALYAIKAGKHVLCEKPFASTLAECDSMIRAAECNQVMLLVYYNMRFHPVVNAVDAHIAEIGSIYAIRLSYTQFRTTLNWRHRLEQGGGVLKSQGVHALDLALRWLGPALTVSGEMAIIHAQREVEDFALAHLRFANGAIGEVYAAYTDRGPEAMRVALQGNLGKLEFCLSPYQPEENGVWLQKAGQRRKIPLREATVIDPVYPGLLDCSQRAIFHLVDHVRAGKPTPLDGHAGRQTIELVLAAYESQRRGTKIALPLESFDTGSLADCFPRFVADGDDLSD